MLIAPILATVLLFAPVQGAKETMCPVMGGPAKAGATWVEYAGSHFDFCCGGCDATFAKAPAATLKNERIKGKIVGTFLFDPVSGKRLEAKSAKGGSSEYGGLRYHFATAANKAAFDKNPKKFGTVPAKESLVCPVSGEAIASYAKASSYRDYSGVRYYICCPDCVPTFAKDMAKGAAKVAGRVKAPGAIASKS